MSRLFEALTGLVLLQPAWLLLLALIPAALLLRRRAGAAAIALAPSAFARAAGRSARARWLALPAALQACGLALLALALARPAAREVVPRPSEGIDIVLCIDLSSSMAATDLDPKRTRLEVAKQVAGSFVRARPQDRIGLVGFARYPDLLCPLTRDHDALGKVLAAASLVASDGQEDATGIGAAVGRSAQALGRSKAGSRVVILLTDGEENVASEQTPNEIGPRRAAAFCQQAGVKVYSVVAGTTSRTVSGQTRPLDPTEVKALAEATGGAFFTAASARTLADVYARIDALEKAEAPDPRLRYEERFVTFVLLGLALALLGRLLGATWLMVAP